METRKFVGGVDRLFVLLLVVAFSLSNYPVAIAQTPITAAQTDESLPLSKPASPLKVVLTASPVENNSARLTLQVTSEVALNPIKIDVSVPAVLQITANSMVQTDSLQENQTKEYQLVLKGDNVAPTSVEARVYASFGGRIIGGFASIPLASRNGSLAVPEMQTIQELPSDELPTTAVPPNAIAAELGVQTPETNVSAAAATITARGQYLYLDHPVTPSGVAATGTYQPFRKAQVQIQRKAGNNWTKVAAGYTADNGAYSFSVPNITVGQNILRSQICTIGPTGNKLQVKTPQGATYCYISQELIAQTDTNFDARSPFDTETGGGPVNIYDTILEAYDYVTAVGSVPASGLTVKWSLGYKPTCGSCYLNNVIDLNGNSAASANPDGDQWDDAIIGHEFGHWVMNKYAAIPPNSGGTHGACNIATTRPNLAYSEGWASFFGSANRSASRNPVIQQQSSHYLDTGGGIGSTFVLEDTDLETVTEMDSSTGRGNFCEWQVAGTLWDIFDANQDSSDTLQRPFADILKTFQTKYNGHFPYNINEWWYGWTNTLRNRPGGSFGFEQAMLNNFTGHRDDIGMKLVLRWGATPRDLDSHLWLPSPTQYHVRWNNKGLTTASPFANLDIDITGGSGLETIWIVSPYVGTYTYAAFDWTDQSDNTKGIGGTNAYILVYDGSKPINPGQPITVPAAGSGVQDWWHVLSLNGASGAITIRNVVQSKSPGPYDIGPAAAEDGLKEPQTDKEAQTQSSQVYLPMIIR